MNRRCVFLDRDGVINAAPVAGEYILRWEEFRFLPGVADWIRLFNTLGLLVIVVTNQRSVALGLISSGELDEIHHRMRDELAQEGARLDDVLCCPHEEGTCECRKPKPGLIEQACRKWDIDLEGSLLIGDSDADRELARRAGLCFIRVANGRIVDITPAG